MYWAAKQVGYTCLIAEEYRQSQTIFIEVYQQWIKRTREDLVDMREFADKATSTPKLFGTGKLGKKSSTPVEASVYLYKQVKKNRKGMSCFPDVNKQYSRTHNFPWVIVTSVCPNQYKARQIINIYKKRMQIEQNFRDDKNCRYGLAWRLSGTTSINRLTILLLIATIATLFLWWIGLTAQQQGLHLRFQANSIKHRRVLSLI